MTRVTIADIRAAGHCPRGTKDWFEAHGLDFRAMLRDGIDEALFLERGDELAQHVVDHKKAQLTAGTVVGTP